MEEVKWSCPCALTEHHAMEAYWENGRIAPLFLWHEGYYYFAQEPGTGDYPEADEYSPHPDTLFL